MLKKQKKQVQRREFSVDDEDDHNVMDTSSHHVSVHGQGVLPPSPTMGGMGSSSSGRKSTYTIVMPKLWPSYSKRTEEDWEELSRKERKDQRDLINNATTGKGRLTLPSGWMEEAEDHEERTLFSWRCLTSDQQKDAVKELHQRRKDSGGGRKRGRPAGATDKQPRRKGRQATNNRSDPSVPEPAASVAENEPPASKHYLRQSKLLERVASVMTAAAELNAAFENVRREGGPKQTIVVNFYNARAESNPKGGLLPMKNASRDKPKLLVLAANSEDACRINARVAEEVAENDQVAATAAANDKNSGTVYDLEIMHSVAHIKDMEMTRKDRGRGSKRKQQVEEEEVASDDDNDNLPQSMMVPPVANVGSSSPTLIVTSVGDMS